MTPISPNLSGFLLEEGLDLSVPRRTELGKYINSDFNSM